MSYKECIFCIENKKLKKAHQCFQLSIYCNSLYDQCFYAVVLNLNVDESAQKRAFAALVLAVTSLNFTLANLKERKKGRVWVNEFLNSVHHGWFKSTGSHRGGRVKIEPLPLKSPERKVVSS